MMSRFAFSLLIFSLFTGVAVADDRPLTIQQWSNRFQAVAGKYNKGETQPQTDLQRQQFLEAVVVLAEAKVR